MTFIGIHTPAPDVFGMLNFHLSGTIGSKYANAEFDEVISEAAVTVDEEQRFDLYRRAQEIMHEDPPALVLHQQQDIYAHHVRVQGWRPRPDEFIFLSGVSIQE
jgi:peptide/nickel transport system substrate-binding protein